ncbi:unnamed protein product [Protopolystoma xenopodis]|uniref:Uncharacterized protein n=1 Tax=Protopolystoma xenopodis TaxID=117903 RepID=A0A448X1P7_9PLAT|nr:unnamed protein product [Protopolystoma xenopodis]
MHNSIRVIGQLRRFGRQLISCHVQKNPPDPARLSACLQTRGCMLQITGISAATCAAVTYAIFPAEYELDGRPWTGRPGGRGGSRAGDEDDLNGQEETSSWPDRWTTSCHLHGPLDGPEHEETLETQETRSIWVWFCRFVEKLETGYASFIVFLTQLFFPSSLTPNSFFFLCVRIIQADSS